MRAIVLEADWDPRPGYPVSEQEIATHKANMACGAWRNPRFSATILDDPSPGPGEVVIRVGACGVCGSDTHCYESDEDGYVIFSGPARLPVVPGHEYAGEVVALGAGVSSLAEGDLVTAEGMITCGTCDTCRQGNPNQCPNLEMVGFSTHGAYAEFIVVEARFCWKLDGVAARTQDSQRTLELGALVEPLACAYNGIFVAGRGMRPGAHVAVHGCGPIGLGAIALARTAGAATITAFDVVPERCAVALSCGADASFDPAALRAAGSSPAEAVLEATRGSGADLQLECAGAAGQTLPEIEQSFAPGGQMIYLGRTGERAPVMLDVLVSNAASIVGSRGHAGHGCFPRIIRLLEQDRLVVEPMITARRPFDEALSAVEQSCLRTDGKILLVFASPGD
jgi:threonine dehydrogenase-like Zn-dependent dehydrogenase